MLALLTTHLECHGLYVTIQREVADRLMAGPGSKAYGSVSVIAQTVAEVRLIATLGPACFWPRPEVSSAMVAIERKPGAAIKAHLPDCCQRLFMSRRKQLGSFLGDDVPWPPGVERTMRAEELTPHQIAALCDGLHRA